jgi:phosphoribosylformylglycinamidine cyclo-ligase
MERPVTFESEGQQVVGMFHTPDGSPKAPAVVLCHGFTGNKSESHFVFVKLARSLADAGMATLRFDFRGSGDSEGSFEEMTISGEIADAMNAVEFLAEQPEVDADRIGVLGLSLGGCVAACVTGRSPLVKATILWAPLHDPDVFNERLSPTPTSFPHEFSGGMLLGKPFVDELPDIDPLVEIRGAQGSVLILHGSADETLRVAWSDAYVSSLTEAGVPFESEIVEGADHTFARIDHERHVIQRSVAWFITHLGEEPKAPRSISYADAGVDIEAANKTKERLRELVRESYTPRVLTELGAFGGLFRADFPDMTDPVLVTSTDGVGTKLKVAIMADKHDTVGRDLVNHCINDILVMGATPLFFQDYVALGSHDGTVVADVVAGLAKACTDTGCALLGGETAEMPDMYQPGEYDLAGTIVGIVDRANILDGSRVQVGDTVLGLGSDGLHTNGYSLARRLLFDEAGWSVDHHVPEWGCSVAEELLKPHRSYLGSLLPLLDADLIHAMAHITGGGLTDNLPRVLPEGTTAKVFRDTWDIPPVFTTLYQLGNMVENEALRAFNMGVGMAVICAADEANDIMSRLRETGERVWKIGEVVESDEDGEGVRYV